MSATPRRSTRGTLFTPSPHPSPAFVQTNTTYSWTSAPLASSSSPSFTHYNSFARIVTHSGLTPRKGKARAGKQDEESRFTVGDGVMVSVEGGEEGVGVLIRLWEELEDEASERSSEEDEGLEDVEIGNDVQDEERGRKMMAEVHWCFRRQDLPGIMKNLSVEDVRRSLLYLGNYELAR